MQCFYTKIIKSVSVNIFDNSLYVIITCNIPENMHVLVGSYNVLKKNTGSGCCTIGTM